MNGPSVLMDLLLLLLLLPMTAAAIVVETPPGRRNDATFVTVQLTKWAKTRVELRLLRDAQTIRAIRFALQSHPRCCRRECLTV
jgi:hypothetical protein